MNKAVSHRVKPPQAPVPLLAVQTDSPAKALSPISYAVLEEQGEISENLH